MPKQRSDCAVILHVTARAFPVQCFHRKVQGGMSCCAWVVRHFVPRRDAGLSTAWQEAPGRRRRSRCTASAVATCRYLPGATCAASRSRSASTSSCDRAARWLATCEACWERADAAASCDSAARTPVGFLRGVPGAAFCSACTGAICFVQSRASFRCSPITRRSSVPYWCANRFSRATRASFLAGFVLRPAGGRLGGWL